MTAAVFQATYSDWRLIKGRKVVQVVFEVPLEGAAIVHDVLGGMPDPSKSVWCAIARMNGNEVLRNNDGEPTEQHHDTPPRAVADNAPRGAKKSWHEMPMAQQAGLLSHDPKFQRFAAEVRYGADTKRTLTEEDAAEFIRLSCAVSSRADILPNTNTGALWEGLVKRYRAWEVAPSVGAA